MGEGKKKRKEKRKDRGEIELDLHRVERSGPEITDSFVI